MWDYDDHLSNSIQEYTRLQTTMKSNQFLELPPEMKIEIIRKCHAIPYVHLRQSCRFIDDFCEQNRTRLGIYCYQKKPHLYLLADLDIAPFDRFNRQKDIDGFHVVINYGKNNGDRNFSVPMTQENISKIRSSLSGFAFTDVTVKNRDATTYEQDKEFDGALQYFLEATVDLKVKSLKLDNLTSEQVQMMVSRWKIQKAGVHRHGSAEILEIEALKKVENVGYACFPKIDQKTIEEVFIRRQTAFLCVWELSANVAWAALKNVLKTWTKRSQSSRFELVFGETPDYINAEIGLDLRLPEGAFYLGNFVKSMKKVTQSKETKWDIWLNKLIGEEDRWQLVSLRRIAYTNYTEVFLTCRILFSTNDLILKLLDLLGRIYPRCPLDCSGFYEKLEKSTSSLKNVKEEFNGIAQSIGTFVNGQETFEDLF